MQENTWKIDFDAPSGEACINDEIFVRDGTLSYEIEKKGVDLDEYSLEDQDSSDIYETIEISGVFCTQFYVGDIRKIETKRYILEGVDVIKEGYGSHEDRIVYEFKCESAQVKYQANQALKNFGEDGE